VRYIGYRTLRRALTPSIKVGILHSLSGTMEQSEIPLRDAELMAIEEINAAGGVLGQPVEAIVEDPASNVAEFQNLSEKLLASDKVCSVFGCWTSASRKAVLSVFEKYDGLLWYPVQYEGNECSRNVIYTGSTPNQQILPALTWLLHSGRRRFFLLGSDYVFPRTANRIIRKHLQGTPGRVVGEEYAALGATDFSAPISLIRKAVPDVVINTVNGSSNRAFYQQYHKAGIAAREIPIMAFRVAEAEVRTIGPAATTGHYAAWAYFQSVDTNENRAFLGRFRDRYGDRRVTSGGEVSGDLKAKYEQITSNSTFTVIALGGNPNEAARISEPKDLRPLPEIIRSGAAYSRNHPGAAISYTTRFLKDNQLARVGFTTDFNKQECVQYPNGFVKLVHAGAYVAKFTVKLSEPTPPGATAARHGSQGTRRLGIPSPCRATPAT